MVFKKAHKRSLYIKHLSIKHVRLLIFGCNEAASQFLLSSSSTIVEMLDFYPVKCRHIPPDRGQVFVFLERKTHSLCGSRKALGMSSPYMHLNN